MEKKCKKCLEVKAIISFVKNKNCKYGREGICRICHNKVVKERPTTKANKKRDYDNNIERIKIYNSNNKEKMYLYGKKREQFRRDEITDRYAKKILREKRGFKKEQITPELIEVQRLIIKTKRLCKTLQS